MMVSSILATQLLSPLGASACSDKNGQCPADTIDNKHFDESNGPWKYVQLTNHTSSRAEEWII
jgi:hypothetical protein